MQILNDPTRVSNETLLWEKMQQQEWKIFISQNKYKLYPRLFQFFNENDNSY